MSQIRLQIDGGGVTVFAVSAEPIEMALYYYEPEGDTLYIEPSWTGEGQPVEVDEPKVIAACRVAYAQAKTQVDTLAERQRRMARFMAGKKEEPVQ